MYASIQPARLNTAFTTQATRDEIMARHEEPVRLAQTASTTAQPVPGPAGDKTFKQRGKPRT